MSNKRRAFNFVLAQFVLLSLLVLSPRSKDPYGPLTLALSVLGLALIVISVLFVLWSFVSLRRSLTASPIPKADGELITSGPYRFVRHPIYSAILLAALGVVLDAGYWPQLVIATMLYVLLNQKASFEEQLLLDRYPGYAQYSRKTPRLLPRFTR